MKKRIMIDGRNLDLEKGTGVATYARNLSYALRDLNFQVEVLYGNRSAPGQNDLIKEIGLFDSNIGEMPWIVRALKFLRETVQLPLGLEATRVPVTGTVILDTFKSRLPYFDELYNSPDLFRKSHNHYRYFGKIHSVMLPSKPDNMAWWICS